MAKSIANLAITLSANISKFTTGMRKASKPIKAFTASIAGAATKLVKFGAIATTVALGALTILVKKSFDAIDATAKLSDRLGIATQDLVGLRHAAEITGVGAAGLDKSIDMLVRRLGEAKQGTGEAVKAIQMLGLNLDRLIAAGPARAFSIIAEEIKKLGSQSEKAAVAYQLFGRQGAALVNTLSLGRQGIRELTKEAELLGLTFTRLQAEGVEKFNDSLARLKALFVGVANQIAISIGPKLEELNNLIIDFVKESGGVANAVKRITDPMIELGDTIVNMVSSLLNLRKSVKSYNSAIVAAAESIPKFREMLFGSKEGVDGLNSSLNELSGTLGNDEIGSGIKKITKETNGLTNAVLRYNRTGGVSGGRTSSGGRSANPNAILERIFNPPKTPLQELQGAMDELNNMARLGTIGFDAYFRALRAIQMEMKELSSVEKVKEALSIPEPDEISSRIGMGGSGRFSDVVVGRGARQPDIKVEGQKEQTKIMQRIEVNTRPYAITGGGATFN